MELTERDVVRIIIDHISRQFPRACPSCRRRFESLQEYILVTTHVGAPISLDAEIGDWEPTEPLGALALANCPCGSTLAIGSKGMSLKTMWKLMRWLRTETKRRGLTPSELLSHLRREIEQQALDGK